MTHDKKMVPVGPNDVIGPDRFGPSLWQGLHYITLGYPDNPTEEQKQKYKTFFLLLKDTLPCSICASHYAENLNKMPITDDVLKNRENFIKWLIDFHNVVNEMKGKPKMDYNKARKLIDTDRPCKKNYDNDFKHIYGLFGVVFVVAIIVYFYKKNKII
jgi:hypothetical protein